MARDDTSQNDYEVHRLPTGPAAGRAYKKAIEAYEPEADVLEWEKRRAERKAGHERTLRALSELYQNEAYEREMRRGT